MEDRETARMRKYGESKTTRIMMATVPHVTPGLGLREFQADGFLLTRVYNTTYHKLYCTVWSSWRCSKFLPETCRAKSDLSINKSYCCIYLAFLFTIVDLLCRQWRGWTEENFEKLSQGRGYPCQDSTHVHFFTTAHNLFLFQFISIFRRAEICHYWLFLS